jgi:hypothetical protein
MALIIPDASEVLMLRFALGDATPDTTCTLRLFVNDYTPVPGSVVGNFTEMTTQNYAPIVLTNTNWTVTAEDPEAQAVQAEQTFTFDGSGGDTIVYGYYVTDDTAGALLWAERFPAPPTVPDTLGGTIKITPKITFATLNDL